MAAGALVDGHDGLGWEIGPGGVEGVWVWPGAERTAAIQKYGDLYDGGVGL